MSSSDEPVLLDPSPVVSARLLLGTVLRRVTEAGDAVAVRITEVEAYAGAADPASHAYKGQTARNAAMFGPPGRLYVYAMHGHFCCNVICTPDGVGGGVLIRAGQIIEGVELARARRGGGVQDHRLARGPGCLTRALGVTRADDGAALFAADSPVRLGPREPLGADRSMATPLISVGPRVGVSRAADVPWRFWLTGDPTVSAYRRVRQAGTQRPDAAR